MQTKAKTKKLTDAERHKRFVEMSKEVEAADDAKAFDKAFESVARLKSPDFHRKDTKTKSSRTGRSGHY